MAEMKLQVEIEAPIKKVFNYIADVSTHPQYATFVASIKFLTTQRIGAGVKFVQKHHGIGTENPTEITEYKPPTRVAWITQEQPYAVDVGYDLTETPVGTIVVHTIRSKNFDDKKVFDKTYKNNRLELDNLKKEMEK